MRCAFASMLFGLSILSSGCALLEDATRNTFAAMRTPIAEHREAARNRRWAEEAWGGVCTTGSYSLDYAQGFKDGYAEYLFRGGDGEPPLVAPPRYRRLTDQTPAGFAAIQDWFHGYRHGAAIARDSGVRQWITGPSALLAGSSDSVPDDVAPVLRDMENQAPELILPAPSPIPLKHEPLPPKVEPIESTATHPLIIQMPPPAPAAMRIPITGIRTAPPDVEPGPLRIRLTGITAVPLN